MTSGTGSSWVRQMPRTMRSSRERVSASGSGRKPSRSRSIPSPRRPVASARSACSRGRSSASRYSARSNRLRSSRGETVEARSKRVRVGVVVGIANRVVTSTASRCLRTVDDDSGRRPPGAVWQRDVDRSEPARRFEGLQACRCAVAQRGTLAAREHAGQPPAVASQVACDPPRRRRDGGGGGVRPVPSGRSSMGSARRRRAVDERPRRAAGGRSRRSPRPLWRVVPGCGSESGPAAPSTRG